jgi:hypothetical protein
MWHTVSGDKVCRSARFHETVPPLGEGSPSIVYGSFRALLANTAFVNYLTRKIFTRRLQGHLPSSFPPYSS